MGEEGELRPGHPLISAGEGEQAELEGAMHPFEQRLGILEVVQARQTAPLHQILEEVLGRGVGRDASGQDHAHAAVLVHQSAAALGEHCVGVDVAAPGQRVTSRDPQQVRFAGGATQRTQVRVVQRRVGNLEGLNEALAGGRVGRGGNLRISDGKELLFLQLDAFPWRVTEHHVEAAAPARTIGWSAGAEQMWELKVPVEEPILGGESLQSGQRGLGQRLTAREGP